MTDLPSHRETFSMPIFDLKVEIELHKMVRCIYIYIYHIVIQSYSCPY